MSNNTDIIISEQATIIDAKVKALVVYFKSLYSVLETRRLVANKQIEQLTDTGDDSSEWQQVEKLLSDEIESVKTELNLKFAKLVNEWEALTGERYFTADFPF